MLIFVQRILLLRRPQSAIPARPDIVRLPWPSADGLLAVRIKCAGDSALSPAAARHEREVRWMSTGRRIDMRRCSVE